MPLAAFRYPVDVLKACRESRTVQATR